MILYIGMIGIVAALIYIGTEIGGLTEAIKNKK